MPLQISPWGAESLFETATPKVGVTPEATQITGAVPGAVMTETVATAEAASPETWVTAEATTPETGATPDAAAP